MLGFDMPYETFPNSYTLSFFSTLLVRSCNPRSVPVVVTDIYALLHLLWYFSRVKSVQLLFFTDFSPHVYRRGSSISVRVILNTRDNP